MRIDLRETEHCLTYVINQVPEVFWPALQHFYFHQEGGEFSKSFQKTTLMFPPTSRLRENLEASLEKMLQNNLGTPPFAWEETLEAAAALLDAHGIRWWLAGSAACAIRGIDILPNDLDIMTYRSEIPKLQAAFNHLAVEPFHFVTDWVVTGFGVVYLHGRVDVALEPHESADAYGRPDFGTYAMNNLETVVWRGYQIKVPPLELHIGPNLARKRLDRVRLIEEYLQRTK